jgi:2-amino-4-hydroxy-6-hydroxymethyldihydropteridine diphosphokinase
MESEGDNVYLGLGSNLGDRAANLRRAVEAIGALPDTELVSVSSLYETEPRMYAEQPDFLNACASIRTSLEPRKLLDELLAIEQATGRVRRVDNGPRTLDVDILLYGQLIIDRPGLQIPHPGIAERAFVLVPLAQVAAEVVHPGVGKTIAELLQACPDAGWVRQSSGKKLVPTSHSTPK